MLDELGGGLLAAQQQHDVSQRLRVLLEAELGDERQDAVHRQLVTWTKGYLTTCYLL